MGPEGINMSESTPETEHEVQAEEAVAEAIADKKQQHKRVSVRVPIRLSTVDPERDPKTGKLYFFTSEEVSANISRGGAFVATPEDIPEGRRILVEIDIPNGSKIQTLGRVVWKRLGSGQLDVSPQTRPGVGIEFTGGRPEHLSELDRYITTASRRRSAPPAMGPGKHPTT